MAISIDYPTGVINVPRADLTLVQSNPTEIRDHLMDDFWRELRAAEDSEEARTFPIICQYDSPTSVGGVELAAVLTITDYYTVTYEDGQYAVNLKGMNTNVGDRVNVNQVSIRSSNSAGLVNSQAIEFGEYEAAVTIDYENITGNAVSGQGYPTGTLRRPSNNIPDSVAIAMYYGFDKIKVIGNLPLGAGDDVSGYHVAGHNAGKTIITVNSDAETLGCEIVESYVTGNLDGGSILRNCVIANLNYINGFVYNCMIDPGVISLGGVNTAHFLNCYSGVPGTSTPTIDMDGAGGENTPLAIRGYNGGIKLIHKTGDASCSIDLASGQVIIDSSCVNGKIVVRGDGKVVDENGNHLMTGIMNGNLELINEANFGQHVHDLWQKAGLDKNNPVIITKTDIDVGDIHIDVTGDGINSSTATRT